MIGWRVDRAHMEGQTFWETDVSILLHMSYIHKLLFYMHMALYVTIRTKFVLLVSLEICIIYRLVYKMIRCKVYTMYVVGS